VEELSGVGSDAKMNGLWNGKLFRVERRPVHPRLGLMPVPKKKKKKKKKK
jgi:hypothetical protein